MTLITNVHVSGEIERVAVTQEYGSDNVNFYYGDNDR